jgi:hypothetical protein
MLSVLNLFQLGVGLSSQEAAPDEITAHRVLLTEAVTSHGAMALDGSPAMHVPECSGVLVFFGGFCLSVKAVGGLPLVTQPFLSRSRSSSPTLVALHFNEDWSTS